MPTASSKNTPKFDAGTPLRSGEGRLPRLFEGELFLLCGESRADVLARLSDIEQYLERPQPAPLQDLAYTVSRRYDPTLQCVAIVATSHRDLSTKLARTRSRLSDEDCAKIHDKTGIYFFSERLGDGKVAFMFPGENAQYVNMLAELSLHFPEIRDAFDEADAACRMADDGFLPSALNFPPPGGDRLAAETEEISQWEKAVVLVHTANIGLSRLLENLHLRPDAVVGHSFGELSALEMAGVLRPGGGKDRIRFAHHAYLHLRELSQERDLPTGRLLAAGGVERSDIDELLGRFPDSLRLAMENCPHQYVLCASGTDADEVIAEAGQWLASQGAICSPLPIRRPYHTPFFEPAFPLEKAYFEEVGVHPPEIEVYSCTTAEPFPSEPEAIVELAARHWMSCVRFQETIERMYERGFRIFIDIGPRGNLCAFVADILADDPHLTVALNRPQRSESLQLFNALGILAANGIAFDVEHLHQRWGSRIVDIAAEEAPDAPSMEVQLPVFLPPLRAEGIELPSPSVAASRPTLEAETAPADDAESGTPAPPAARRAAPPVGAAEGTPAASASRPGSRPAPGTAQVLGNYMETMERFLATEEAIMTSLLSRRRGPDASTTPGADRDRLALLGTIREQVPAESLVAERTFDVEEDLYLNDHSLGGRISTTDPSIRGLPIMPILFSIEVAAEAAVALFPQLCVSAAVDTRGHRWIFFDRGSVRLRTVARRVDAPGQEVRVHVSIRQQDDQEAARAPEMFETTIVLAQARPEPRPSDIEDLPASVACDWSGRDIYPRRTFHGPLFQGIRRIDRLSEKGLDGTVEVPAASGVLRSRPDAVLETEPLLADSLGQAAWLWGSPEPFNGVAYLPFALDALRFYGPSVPAGTALDLKLRIRRRESRTSIMDIEGVDDRGKVRVALEGLADRELPITPSLHRLIMEPLDQYFADVRTVSLPSSRGERDVSLATIVDFPTDVLEGAFGVWRKALAFLLLSPAERAEWMEMDVPLQREIHWLLGRAAVKDALRHRFRTSLDLGFAAADLVVRNEETGRPYLEAVWRAESPPAPAAISISHTAGMVAGAALDAPRGWRLGIDVESVREPSQDLVEAAFSESELEVLPAPASGDEERAEWIFRFWCAKEAVSKAIGTGLQLDPRALVISRAETESGSVTVTPGGGDEAVATTFRRGRHIVALALLPPARTEPG